MGFVKPASKKPEYTLLADKPMAVWSGIVLNFIARRVEARGGAWRWSVFLQPAFNSSLLDSSYDCKIRQNAT